jgi:crotonobetainyl-CoA:carnitine CoA-transferase CaiB-like acyl-CoA transferase
MLEPVPSKGLPLSGTRALCITTVFAGPYASQLLADWGCEVIRVESTQFWQMSTRGPLVRPSREMVMKAIPPSHFAYPDREPGPRPWNRAAVFNEDSRNKLSMTVDLTKPKGIEILRRLVKISDFFIENNSPNTMDHLGLTYDFLKQIKPDIIMIRMPAFGLSGPYRNYRALGQHITDVAGFNDLMGYTDMGQALDGLTTTFCDAVAGAGGALAALMALRHRRKTGKGLMVEAAQLDCLLPQLGESIMDYTLNHRVNKSINNHDFHGAAPSGNYRCKGYDRWISITVHNDSEWQALCQAMGNPDWVRNDEFSTSLNRYKNQDQLDKLLENWTLEYDCYELMRLLQSDGVPAAPVTEASDCLNDPHFKETGVMEEVEHPECGSFLYPGMVWTQAKTPNHIRRHAPRLGEDNEYIYKQLLGISNEEYGELESEGHIGMDYAAHVDPGARRKGDADKGEEANGEP